MCLNSVGEVELRAFFPPFFLQLFLWHLMRTVTIRLTSKRWPVVFLLAVGVPLQKDKNVSWCVRAFLSFNLLTF